MTYAWSDVTRNAGIRKTNWATRYIGPRIFAHVFNDVTYMINEYNVHIVDACYYIAAHALPDAHCVIALWRITFMLRKVLISVSEWPWQRDPFTVAENLHGETPSHKTYTCQLKKVFCLLLPGAELPSWKFWPPQRPLSISLNPARRVSSFWSSFGRCPV